MDYQKHAVGDRTCHQNERKDLHYLVFLGSWSQELSSSSLSIFFLFFLLFLCFRPHTHHFSPMIRCRRHFPFPFFFSSSFPSSKCGGSGRPRRDVVVVSSLSSPPPSFLIRRCIKRNKTNTDHIYILHALNSILYICCRHGDKKHDGRGTCTVYTVAVSIIIVDDFIRFRMKKDCVDAMRYYKSRTATSREVREDIPFVIKTR